MFKILFGIIVGVALTLMALNPNTAKTVMAKGIDAVSESYQTGAKKLNEAPPLVLEIPKIPTEFSNPMKENIPGK